MRIAVIVLSELVPFILNGVVVPAVKVSLGIVHPTENTVAPGGTKITGGIPAWSPYGRI